MVPGHLFDIYTTIGELSSKFDEFLAENILPIRDLCAFAFYCPLFFTKKNNAALHLILRMHAVFALDVATALRQINR